MERDFLGLSDKQYLSNVKCEVHDDAVGSRGLNKTRLLGKSKVFATSNFTMPSSGFQETKAFPGAYQWGSVSAANVFRRGGVFQNANPLLLGGSIPLTHPSILPRVASSGPFPQLTIFYGETVSVFSDVSPNKALAIMSCVGNGMIGETGDSKLNKQQPIGEGEREYGNQIHKTATAASSSSATLNDTFSTSKDKPVVVATNAMNMTQSFSLAHNGSMISSVPQARKASLARFLEKRKERLLSAMPYKKMRHDLSTGESSGMNYSSASPL